MSATLTLDDAMLASDARGPRGAQGSSFERAFVAERQEQARVVQPWHLRVGTGRRRQASSPVFALVMVAALAATVLGLRRNIVAAMPETAVLFSGLGLPVNLRGLDLNGVKSGIFPDQGMDVLVVQGEIANVTKHRQNVPPLRFTVRDARGMEIYSWVAAADVTRLDPGAKATFRRRLASPPPEGADVMVRFAGKPD